MKGRCTRAAAVLVLLVAGAATSAAGRAGVGQARLPGAWEYPQGQRDPLVPPPALYTTQSLPPIEVTLIGLDSHDPGRPLAVVRLDSRPPVRKVVRPGDRIGEYRILRIGRRSVRIAAPSLGGTSVMELEVRDSSSSSTR